MQTINLRSEKILKTVLCRQNIKKNVDYSEYLCFGGNRQFCFENNPEHLPDHGVVVLNVFDSTSLDNVTIALRCPVLTLKLITSINLGGL